MRGAIASATAAWANLFSRCASIHASTPALILACCAAKNVQTLGTARTCLAEARPPPDKGGGRPFPIYKHRQKSPVHQQMNQICSACSLLRNTPTLKNLPLWLLENLR